MKIRLYFILHPSSFILHPFDGAAHHRAEEVFEHAVAVFAEARVDGRGLDDCAARGDEPVEARALWEQSDGASQLAALADAEDGREVTLDGVAVERGIERGE